MINLIRMWSDNPTADFNHWDSEQQKKLEKRPVCSQCGEHIQDESAYFIFDKWVCNECMEDFKEDIYEDYD